MVKDDTRAVLLEVGTQLFLEYGYNHTGVQAVLKEAGLPKGSFYHYFGSKRDFGLEVLDRYCREQEAHQEQYLEDDSLPPLERIRRFFGSYIHYFEERGCREGCLIGNLDLELADRDEAFRHRIEAYFTASRDRLAACLDEASRDGLIPPGQDTRRLADFGLNSWEGAILRMKACKSVLPLKNFLHFYFRLIGVAV